MPTNELTDKLYSILKERASKYDPIYYGDLYKKVGLNHDNIGDRKIGSQLLETANLISGKEYMISSFAVSKGNNGPYQGFYALAERWGRIKAGLTEQKKMDFWIEEMKRVFNKYRK